MSNDNLNRSDRSNKVDLTSVVISNLAVIIQIVAVGATGLANVLKVDEIFPYRDLVTLANFLVLLLSFSFIGLYNFNKSNKSFVRNQSGRQGFLLQIKYFLFGEQSKSLFDYGSEKTCLKFLFLILIISTFSFFSLTYKSYTTQTELLFWEGDIQLSSYIVTLVISSILIYMDK